MILYYRHMYQAQTNVLFCYSVSALTLLVGWQEGCGL